MIVKCLVDYGISLKKDKVYRATKVKRGWLALIDETHEEYVYPPNIFEVIRNVDDIFSIDNAVSERADGKGFWNKNKKHKNTRVKAFYEKVNINNESYYLEHPEGGFVCFDNKLGSLLQSAKLISNEKSFYYVDVQSDFVIYRILEEARRQIETADFYRYKLEWLISYECVANQLKNLFISKNLPITMRFFPE